MSDNYFTEKNYLIRDINLRVKHWHVDADIKVIALHGWLDNAGSFDVLAKHLPFCSIAAIDLAGQGFSDYRPASASYHLWDDIVDIISIANALAWQKFIVIGHSRGAMLANILAATFPERIQKVIALDAIMPMPEPLSNSVQQMRHYITDTIQLHHQHFYPTREQALLVRAKASGVDANLLEPIAIRQLRQAELGWYWHLDHRLKSASAMKMSDAHIACFLSAITAPVLVILAAKGLGRSQYIKSLEQLYPQFSWCYLEGHHHFHLMDESAQEITALCLKHVL